MNSGDGEGVGPGAVAAVFAWPTGMEGRRLCIHAWSSHVHLLSTAAVPSDHAKASWTLSPAIVKVPNADHGRRPSDLVPMDDFHHLNHLEMILARRNDQRTPILTAIG